MKSTKTSPTSSPQHYFSRDMCLDPHAEFEMELNRNLGNLVFKLEMM